MDKIKSIIKSSIDTKQSVLQNEGILKAIAASVDVIVNAFRSGKRVYFCGNGGSAADAQHLAAEFSGRFYTDRKALPAEALHCNTSYLTAVANDYSFDDIYSRLIDGIGGQGDVLVGLSTSGNSLNIIKAFTITSTVSQIVLSKFSSANNLCLVSIDEPIISLIFFINFSSKSF